MSTITFPDLPALAQHLRDKLQTKKFVLIYAYNGTGKTRLSTEFKNIGKAVNDDGETIQRDTLYFNAFTEDLFTWDNDLDNDRERVLKFNQDSSFFAGLWELEMDNRIRPLLDRYADFDFKIDTQYWQVSFFRKVESDDDVDIEFDIKVSRGEENIFIWCFFLAIVQLVLDGAEAYQWVKYIYIDDPISSLDEHNAIVVGNHLVQLYRDSELHIPTVVSTHHTLFFNVLHYEIKNHLGRPSQYTLKRDSSLNAYLLDELKGDTPQFYHVSALAELWELAHDEKIRTYHFNVLRSILEKTAFFHGYGHFASCIKKDAHDSEGILHQRFVDILSHGKYSMYEPIEMQEQTRDYFRAILDGFLQRHPFNPILFPENAALVPASLPPLVAVNEPGTAATPVAEVTPTNPFDEASEPTPISSDDSSLPSPPQSESLLEDESTSLDPSVAVDLPGAAETTVDEISQTNEVDEASEPTPISSDDSSLPSPPQSEPLVEDAPSATSEKP